MMPEKCWDVLPEVLLLSVRWKEGVIANYTVTQKLLAYVIEKVAGKSLFFKPRVMTCVPIGITSVEKRAVMEATTRAVLPKPI